MKSLTARQFLDNTPYETDTDIEQIPTHLAREVIELIDLNLDDRYDILLSEFGFIKYRRLQNRKLLTILN